MGLAPRPPFASGCLGASVIHNLAENTLLAQNFWKHWPPPLKIPAYTTELSVKRNVFFKFSVDIFFQAWGQLFFISFVCIIFYART